jgi:hypothetical protein
MTAVHSDSRARRDAAGTIRPELRVLTGEQKHRVLEQVRRRHGSCRHCDGDAFAVGDALYLGFLFRSEDSDAYMVALSCTNPACPAPRIGVRLPESEFLSDATRI